MFTSTLVICMLDVQSSYVQNVELPATEQAFDTVQYYASEHGAWHIRTFAVDQDVRVRSLGAGVADIVELAQTNTQKHYGDVLRVFRVFQATGGVEGLRIALAKHGMWPQLEIGPGGSVFWTAEGSQYRHKSLFLEIT
jgi:hypothetical protein